MPRRLRDHPEALDERVRLVATKLRLEPAFIEKDFWVTEVLRSLAQRLDLGEDRAALVIFKGGTSLSKALSLIERFSEDLDILIATRGLGKDAIHRHVLKGLADRVVESLGLGVETVASEKGVQRVVRYAYPRVTASVGTITPHVQVEMGCRGGPEPHTTVEIRSLLAAHGPAEESVDMWEEHASFPMAVLAPERTLVGTSPQLAQ